MYALAILDSGNYALGMVRILERMGYQAEVISIPCKIAKNGCGYCLKFRIEYKDIVLRMGFENKYIIREMYKVFNEGSNIKYEKIY